MSIAVLQLLTATFWFVTALVVAPGTARLFFGRPRPGDGSKGGFFFAAIIFVGGASRWLLRPDDLLTWKFVYAMSIALAVYVWVNVWNMRRDR